MKAMMHQKRDALGIGLREPAHASPAFELPAEVGRSVVRFTNYENFDHGWSHGSSRLRTGRQVAENGILSAKDFCDGRPTILNPQADASKTTQGKKRPNLHRIFTTFAH